MAWLIGARDHLIWMLFQHWVDSESLDTAEECVISRSRMYHLVNSVVETTPVTGRASWYVGDEDSVGSAEVVVVAKGLMDREKASS